MNAEKTGNMLQEKTKPHVLFMTEEEGIGAWYFPYNLWGSLEATGLATYECFHHDTFFKQNGQSGDIYLINQCRYNKPDLIVFRIFYFDGIHGPTPQTLLHLRRGLGIPLIGIYADSDLVHQSLLDSLAAEGIMSVMLDASSLYTQENQNRMVLSLWTPYDTRLFKDSSRNRDIDVCFVGTVEGSHPDREIMISALKKAGISVISAGSNLNKDKRIPLEQYIETLQRSKISLNFSKSNSGLFQVKGRVFETMLCGAMLLEQSGAETSRLFEEGKEYISFTSASDLISKISYYLAHGDERKSIAEAGKKAVQERYSPEKYWKTLFKKARILF